MAARSFCATSSLLMGGSARKAIITPAATSMLPGEQHPSRCLPSRSSSSVPTMLLRLGPPYLTPVAT